MRRMTFGVGTMLACLTGLAIGLPAWACGYGMPSPLVRFIQADCVVVGKVTGVEPDSVSALPFEGAGAKASYQVAVVKVSQNLKGAEGLTHVRIGFSGPMAMQPGQEACFLLTQHFSESFYHLANVYAYPINNEGQTGFAPQIAQFQQWGKLLADPDAGLKSKDAQERFLTAALLISKYRTVPQGVPVKDRKERAINGDRSKQILEALATADWSKAGPDFRVTPRRLFLQLGATAKEGWRPQAFKTPQEFEAAAKKWLKENSGSFRLKAFTAG